jgi:hypothetical protein
LVGGFSNATRWKKKGEEMITTCKDCGKEISSNKTICPHCTASEPEPKYNTIDIVIFVVVAFFVVVVGARFLVYQERHSIDNLIPSSAVKGGLINFTVAGVEVQEGKSRNGGMLVMGRVMVPHDIKREQVKPTLLAAIKGLKDKHRKCEWIIVYAVPSYELKGSSTNAGMAEYADGKIKIDYGVPSATQLAAEVGAAKELDRPDNDPLRLMSKEEFDLAVSVNEAWQDIHLKLLDEANKKAMQSRANFLKVHAQETGDIETKILKLTSQKMNLPAAKIKSLRKQLIMYYGPFWGNETIG